MKKIGQYTTQNQYITALIAKKRCVRSSVPHLSTL
jgi:hypothetical protein